MQRNAKERGESEVIKESHKKEKLNEKMRGNSRYLVQKLHDGTGSLYYKHGNTVNKNDRISNQCNKKRLVPNP